ncbi:NADH-quinone oxidoreductase subunit H [Thermomonospora umbrina]|uniref:NADH dehydrogenase subunit H n=1 Tax=Thermomonospora umbrina TaxID=111806 RepID=A0A3D9T0L9_9ACTN|nr:NADH-quinone oxidoreductase subunit H [Thermomonospora umbrina]REE99873.1 NADH dehydrogenase subunit H [Thermomonospora umbrina]
MSEATPVWAVAALPVALGLLTLGAAAFDGVLAGRRAGHAGVAGAAVGPLREAARLLVQSRRTTLASDGLLLRAGAVSLPVAALLAVVVVPLGDVAVADMTVGVVWFNAMEVVAWASVWLVGWGPNSVYGLVGGYRFIAQGLAYELPHMFALITVAVGAGSLQVSEVADAQAGSWFAVWMPVAFVVYLMSVLAMAFWGPFGQAVADDVAGGAVADLSGVDRLVFLSGRYALLVAGAAFAVPAFLGGGAGPLLPAGVWVSVKVVAVSGALVWAGRRLPLVRMDRFAQFAWVVLIPASLLQLLVVSIAVL